MAGAAIKRLSESILRNFPPSQRVIENFEIGIFMLNQKQLLALALGFIIQLIFASPNGAVTRPGAPQNQVVGRWIGKFPLPDDNSITEDENPIAVEVNLKADGGKLSGVATFYLIRNKDGKPQIVNKKESEMIAPQFDGKTLKFSVKSKGQQPGTERTVQMQMTLSSPTEAELETPDDSSAGVFKMKKTE